MRSTYKFSFTPYHLGSLQTRQRTRTPTTLSQFTTLSQTRPITLPYLCRTSMYGIMHTTSSATSSKKRKLGDGGVVKYYAVQAGNVPGVYTNWEDCKLNTYGFRGAKFKSFPTRKDAEAFVAGKNPAYPSAVTKYYGLAVGDKPGVYTDWAECQRNMMVTKGPKYRKFSTAAEAGEYVKDWKKFVEKEKKAALAGDEEEGVTVEDGPSAKKVKVESKSAVTNEDGKPEKVYTDGSSLGNGKVGSTAGVGVYFGPDDPRNVSEPLPGNPQTNQRAELCAIQRALEILPRSTDVEIITDSQYSINCVTTWYAGWVRKGWKTASGGPVMNRDLVEVIRALIDERTKEGGETEFTWVKGHSGGIGNEAADRLAVAGATAARQKSQR